MLSITDAVRKVLRDWPVGHALIMATVYRKVCVLLGAENPEQAELGPNPATVARLVYRFKYTMHER